MAEHLDSTNLVPFKKRRPSVYHLPGLGQEQDDELIDEVDPKLRPEEQSFVRHYLNYADIMLRNASDTIEEKTPEPAKAAADPEKVDGDSMPDKSLFPARDRTKDAA